MIKIKFYFNEMDNQKDYLIDTILIIKIQHLYIRACHDYNHNKLEQAHKNILEALDDYHVVIKKIDPTTEMYPLLMDLKYNMDNTFNIIEHTIELGEISYYEPPWDFFSILHAYFPCFYGCTKHIKEVYYQELVRKLRNKNNELMEKNQQLKKENQNYKNYTENIVSTNDKYVPGKKYKYKSC